ncbi:MAG: helix-turn-helix domain-containing protein [Kiritimatiellia bacterium]
MPRKRKPINWDEWPDVLTVNQVAPIFGWGVNTYYYHAKRGRVPSHTVGRRRLVYKAELMRHLGIDPKEQLTQFEKLYPAAI